MTKTTTYRNGTLCCRSYFKPVGNGWEVGFYYGRKLAFVGNFIHSWEATRWYTLMNHHIRTFSKRYKVGRKFPKTTYCNFLTNYLYERYYAYLDGLFTTYRGQYGKETTRWNRTHRRLARCWSPAERVPLLRAA